MDSSKYAAPIYSSITPKNYIIHYLQARPKLPQKIRDYYDKFIENFFDNYTVHDTPLSLSSLLPIVEVYMNDMTTKFPGLEENLPEEIEWMNKIQRSIDIERLNDRTIDYAAWANFQTLMAADNVDILPIVDGIADAEYRLMQANWAFDKSYMDSLDTMNNIINIGGLHTAVQYI